MKQTPGAGTAKSLDQLEPLSPSALSRRAPTREVAKARQEPLYRLSAEALLALLHDGRGLKHILPLAVQVAQVAPWADRGLHRGDLLMAVLHAPARVRPLGSRLSRSIVTLAKSALKAGPKLPKAQRQPDLEAEITRWLQRLEHWPEG